jgi:hypothetical protein
MSPAVLRIRIRTKMSWIRNTGTGTRYLKEALQVCAVPAALGEEAGAQRANDGLLGGQEAEQVARSVPQRRQGESATQVRQAAQEGGQVPLHTEKNLG